MTTKLQTLSVRNVNKRLRQREQKLSEAQIQVKKMEVEKRAQNKTIQKLGSQLHTAHTSMHNLRQQLLEDQA